MKRQMGNGTGTSSAAKLVIAIPFILVLYPMALVIGGRSESAVVFDRYSYALAAFLTMAVLLYIVFAVALVRRNGTILALSLLVLVAVTFVLATSNRIVAEPVTLAVLAAARLTTAIALATVAMLGVQDFRPWWTLILLSCGALLFVPSTIDTGYLGWLSTQEVQVWPENTYRPAYDLKKLSDRDIVLLGDSFVWGLGVGASQRVGDVLETKLQQQHAKAKVYSLGVVGWGLKEYATAIREFPQGTRVRRLIISFYPNDMPARETLEGWLEPLSEALGRSSISARLLLDFTRVSLAPSLDGYAKLILGDYDEAGPRFAGRWKVLVDSFDELFGLASQHSVERPMLVIMPILSATDGAQWLSVHRRVGAAAKAAGFDVLDLYDAFSIGTPRAADHRLAPNDLHLSVEGNSLFADKLLQALQATAPPPRRP